MTQPVARSGVEFPASRTYFEILRSNAFTFINTVLFAVSLILIGMGHPGDALATAGLVALNVAVGVYQEARAKRTLDRIALLARPRAAVLRGGRELALDPGQVVPGDVLVVRPGDPIVADGEILAGGRIEVDESLISGESERIPKAEGDAVFSGSFCTAGTARCRAGKVGGESLVGRMTAGARAYRRVLTPLQRDINLLIRILVLVVGALGILLGISFAMQRLPLVDSVRVAAVIVALVPQGLFFMTTVAYAMGAVRVAGSGALVQGANAVESLSSVDLLCLDKTGTLTANRIRFRRLHALPGAPAEAELRSLLGDYACSASGADRTLAELKDALGGNARRLGDEVPFSSDRRWGAVAFDDPARRGTYLLGAPDALFPGSGGAPWQARAGEWTAAGMRVLMLAGTSAALRGGRGEGILPAGLEPLCLIAFEEELRPEAAETLRRFRGLGIAVKIISGDDPRTVAALYRQVVHAEPRAVLSGSELEILEGSARAEALERTDVFGRIDPRQKEELVRAFQERGRYVAMIGDGVNDVLPLKQAQVGIAMQSGSAAARSVADIVLLGDSFAALPAAFREGQRIVRGMEDVVRLLLTRTFYVILLIAATQFVGAPFPITPKHNALLALLTVGLPILAIAAWARPGPSPRRILHSTFPFVIPAAFSVAASALAVYLAFLARSGGVETARSALTAFTVLCGLLLIPFVEPPGPAWTGGDELSGDRRPAFLALAMLAAFAAVLAAPVPRSFFELELLGWSEYALLAALAAAWALLLRAAWRMQLLRRLLTA